MQLRNNCEADQQFHRNMLRILLSSVWPSEVILKQLRHLRVTSRIMNIIMCISICWVNSQYEISEDPLGLVQLPDTRASF